MTNQLWKSRWRSDDIAFHQLASNPLLARFWPQLALPAGARVLVPLCGKSLDMAWLLDAGYRVLGVELSPVAVAAAFEALGVTPQRQHHGRFVRSWHGDLEIWCGDLFDLKGANLDDVAAVYDCAALTALSAKARHNYVRLLGRLLPATSQILLLTTEGSDDESAGITIDDEIANLYQPRFAITLLHGERCLKVDPSWPDEPPSMLEEKVYLMRPPAA